MAKNRVITIDIGTDRAKIVQIVESSGTMELVNARVVTYPNTEDKAEIVESVKQLWASLGDAPLQSGLRALLNRDKTDIILTLPRFLVNTKRLPNLPAATDEQLESIVTIAAEAELPFRIEDAIFTYHDVQRTAEACSVELISTRRTTVTNYLDILEEIGVSASAVTPSMIAIAAVAAETAGTQPRFIVDIGAEHTDFCFMWNGKLQFSRSFRLGGNHLSEHLSRELNLDAQSAEAEKRHISADDAAIQTWTTQLIGEIRRSITATTAHLEAAGDAQRTFSDADTEVWLCGEGARVLDLAETCEAAVGVPTRVWNPLQALQGQASFAVRPGDAAVDGVVDEWGDTLAVALGAGIGALKSEESVSLLPKETAETLTQTARQQQLLAVGGLAILIVGGILFGTYTFQRSRQYRDAEVDSQLAYYAQSVSKAKEQIGRELALTDMLAHQVSPLDVLHVLSGMFKDRTQVAWTNFNITNLHDPSVARITFNLEGSSHNAINTLLRALDRSGVFTNVRPGEVTAATQDRKQVFQVQVRCNLSGAALKAFAQKRYPMPEIPIEEPAEGDIELDIPPPMPEALETEKTDTDEPAEGDTDTEADTDSPMPETVETEKTDTEKIEPETVETEKTEEKK